MTTSDCIIVGGGIIGMLSARELAMHGFKTSLIDSGALGRQCSWAGGGIISALYPWTTEDELDAISVWSRNQYPFLAENLRDTTGIDPELWQCGMLVHTTEDLATAVAWARRKFIRHEVLEAEQAARIAPALDRQPVSWLWIPGLYQVRNPRLLSALKINLQKLGVKLFEFTEVKRVIINKQKAQGVETVSGKFNAPVIVLSCGAWTSRLWPGITVKPVRGQMICFQADRNFLQTMVLKKGKYAIPRRDGHILVGSTVEDVGFDSTTSREAHDMLIVAAEDMLPGITKYPLRAHWAGLRPATGGVFPCIGAWPETAGLFLNTGHNRNGVALAPGSARLLLDCIMQREPPFPADAFQPSAAI